MQQKEKEERESVCVCVRVKKEWGEAFEEGYIVMEQNEPRQLSRKSVQSPVYKCILKCPPPFTG